MKYLGQSDYQHATMPRIGVLLTNLGTPEAPTAKALKPYLKQFLWDPRVVEVPRPIWWLILNGIILNTRPKRSAEAYSAVWNERGSPLLAHLEDQVAGVSAQLTSQHGDRFVVRGAMRYGSPAIAERLVFGTHAVSDFVRAHLEFAALPAAASEDDGRISPAIGLAEQLSLIFSLQMWLGIIVGGLLLWLAVYFRNRNNDL